MPSSAPKITPWKSFRLLADNRIGYTNTCRRKNRRQVFALTLLLCIVGGGAQVAPCAEGAKASPV